METKRKKSNGKIVYMDMELCKEIRNQYKKHMDSDKRYDEPYCFLLGSDTDDIICHIEKIRTYEGQGCNEMASLTPKNIFYAMKRMLKAGFNVRGLGRIGEFDFTSRVISGIRGRSVKEIGEINPNSLIFSFSGRPNQYGRLENTSDIGVQIVSFNPTTNRLKNYRLKVVDKKGGIGKKEEAIEIRTMKGRRR